MKISVGVPTTWMLPVLHLLNSAIRPILRGFAGIALVVLASLPTRAQETTPRIEVFGGYSYTRFDTKTLGYSGETGLNGGTLMVAANLTRNFGGLAQASVGYGGGVNLRDALFGPQFLLPRGKLLFFAHGLFGRARGSVRAATSQLDTQNAQAFGGGIDMNYRNHLAIRLIQAEYFRTQLFQHDQTNLRFSTGLVYQWGGIRRKGHRAPSIPTP